MLTHILHYETRKPSNGSWGSAASVLSRSCTSETAQLDHHDDSCPLRRRRFDSLLKKIFLTYKPQELSVCKKSSCCPFACQQHWDQAQACILFSVISTLTPPLIYVYQQEKQTIATEDWTHVRVLSIGNTQTTKANRILFNSKNINDFSRNFQTCSHLISLEMYVYIQVF